MGVENRRPPSTLQHNTLRGVPREVASGSAPNGIRPAVRLTEHIRCQRVSTRERSSGVEFSVTS